MPRPLIALPADDPADVLGALRSALAGGPAIMPLPHGADLDGLPQEVPQRVALVVQTSGSTGAPKRVALSADALLASAAASEGALGGPGQWLLALPAHYIAGINVLVRSIAAGTEPVLLPSGHFDPIAFAEAAATMDHPARYTSLVPVQLARLLGVGDAIESATAGDALEVLRRFDRILVGGQATPTGLLAQALELGLNVTRTYGSSETSGGCVYDGIPIGTTVVRVIDGELQLGGSVLAEGYLGDEERTARAFGTEESVRWYRTGDTGEVVDGVVRVTGRLDDMIVSGGVKVSLGAVERVVRSLPGLADAVVIRRADERWGEVPVVVTTSSGSLDEIRSVVAAELGAAARPARLVVVETIPLLASGKPDRASLSAR